MIEISIEEYSNLTSQLAIFKEQLGKLKLFWFIYLVLMAIYVFILIDTQPDKETRKRIKKLAKEKKIMQHVVVNTILRRYFEACDLAAAKKIYEDNKQESFEDWKATKEQSATEELEKEQKHKQIVRPKKKTK